MTGPLEWATSVLTRIQLQDPASLPLPSPHPPFPGSSAALGRPGAGLSPDQPLAVLSCRLFPWALPASQKPLPHWLGQSATLEILDALLATVPELVATSLSQRQMLL